MGLPNSYGETLVTRKAIKTAIQMGNPNITIESDSQVAIKSIIGQMQAPKQISKAIENVRNLVNNV